jgi:hypothetical protein
MRHFFADFTVKIGRAKSEAPKRGFFGSLLFFLSCKNRRSYVLSQMRCFFIERYCLKSPCALGNDTILV